LVGLPWMSARPATPRDHTWRMGWPERHVALGAFALGGSQPAPPREGTWCLGCLSLRKADPRATWQDLALELHVFTLGQTRVPRGARASFACLGQKPSPRPYLATPSTWAACPYAWQTNAPHDIGVGLPRAHSQTRARHDAWTVCPCVGSDSSAMWH
jgi:hypothetical protein